MYQHCNVLILLIIINMYQSLKFNLVFFLLFVVFFVCFCQWHNSTTTTAGRAAAQIGYSGEKDCRLWICASRTGGKESMLFLCRIKFITTQNLLYEYVVFFLLNFTLIHVYRKLLRPMGRYLKRWSNWSRKTTRHWLSKMWCHCQAESWQ